MLIVLLCVLLLFFFLFFVKVLTFCKMALPRPNIIQLIHKKSVILVKKNHLNPTDMICVRRIHIMAKNKTG